MKELSEKLLLVAAGAAVGALGYMAYKHPDELKEMVDKVMAQGQDFFEEQLKEFAENMPQSKEG